MSLMIANFNKRGEAVGRNKEKEHRIESASKSKALKKAGKVGEGKISVQGSKPMKMMLS